MMAAPRHITDEEAARIPVIVGIGEVTEQLKPEQIGREPLSLVTEAIRLALEDSGARDTAALADIVGALDLVNQMGWRYEDLARSAADAAGLHNAGAIQSPVGGNMPTKLLGDLAVRIAAGQLQAGVVCGVEATASLMAAGKLKQSPPWTPQPPADAKARRPDFFHPEALKYELFAPTDVYPFYDNALRAHWKQSYAQAQAESGRIGALMSQAAANNPHAWLPKAHSADEVATPSPSNRMVSHPYTKWMVANPMVNQASAVVVTSLAQARRLGIPVSKLAFVWSGAGGAEPRDILGRVNYTQAPAMEAVLRRTLYTNGLGAEELDLLELYSCFPSVPKLARRTLGIPADRPLSVTGGLVFFGAPVNNYMGHAICAMVRALRAGQGRTGLLYGNGEYVTKHHALVLASRAAPAINPLRNLDLQAELDDAVRGVPAVEPGYSGPSRIETYTVKYGRDGAPEQATLIARTPGGKRHLARVTDFGTLAALVSPEREAIGLSGAARTHEDGLTYWELA
ncbi:MAG: acetyl-CoA acetyltransferase [Pseudomonadota bacterium]